MSSTSTRGSTLASIRASLALLTPAERARYWLVVAAQMATGLMDLLGVLLIGGVGVLASTAVAGRRPPASLTAVLDAVGLQHVGSANLAVFMAVAAAVFFLAKSVIYGYLIGQNYKFLAKAQSQTSNRLLSSLLSRPITDVYQLTPQETVYAVTSGAVATITGLLGSVAIVCSDAFLLVLLGFTIFLFAPAAALGMAGFFLLVGWVMHLMLSRWAARTGTILQASDVQTLSQVQEGLHAFRELWTLDRREPYLASISTVLESGARAQATAQLINQIPKLVYDCALVVGAVLLAALQLRTGNMVDVVSTLVVFLAAGSRLVPSMLRLSGQLVNIRSSIAQSARTRQLAQVVRDPLPASWMVTDESAAGEPSGDQGFRADVTIDGVHFTYKPESPPALTDISLTIPAGTSLAIVGRTGAGKSTLADVIIGVLSPQHGGVLIGGLPPWKAISTWPGKIAYLPQHVSIFNATIRDNVALALPRGQVSDDQVWESLERAQADGFVRQMSDGLDTLVGDRGLRLSGGQRQRLGLARGLLTRPSVLVLDEATSALDAETEHAISQSIAALSGTVTAIVIAHRLATVRNSDAVVYLEQGTIRAHGNFDHVRTQVPAFDRQAELLGLVPDEGRQS